MFVFWLQKYNYFLEKRIPFMWYLQGKKTGYAKRLVCRMPRRGDCESAQKAVILHSINF